MSNAQKNATNAVFQRCNSSSVITQAAVFRFLPLSDGTVSTDLYSYHDSHSAKENN